MEKVLRSFIHEHFPLELRVEMELIKRRRDIINDAKHEEIIKLLQSNGMTNYTKLGPGTNRYAFKQDGFVVKVATDRDGQIDNFKEFKMTKRLYPDMSKTYEVATNGDILIAEYIQPFSTFGEMLKYADQIREKLKRIGAVYLLGDVGISSNNFANWGLRIGSNDPVCLDYAYVYDVSSSLFICRECKGDPGVLIPDKDYNFLYCSKCGAKKKFEDIRAMIGNNIHNHEIGDLTLEGYELFESNVLTELTESRSNYLIHIDQNKKNDDGVDFDVNIKEENNMSNTINLLGAEPLSSAGLHGGITIVPTKVISIDEYEKELAANEGKSDAEFIDLTEGSVDDPASAIKEVEVVDEPSSEEDDSNDEYDSLILTDRVFIRNGHTALSKLSNRIVSNMKDKSLFEDVEEYLYDKKMKDSAFYSNLQRAILQSLASFIGCLEKTGVPNKNKPGVHTEYILPDEMIGSDAEPALIFIARMFLNPNLKDLLTPSDAALDLYYAIYDNYLGIPSAWWPIFKATLLQKVRMSQDGIYEIYSAISEEGWLDLSKELKDLESPENEEEEEDEEKLYTEDEEEDVATPEDDDFPDISGTYTIEQTESYEETLQEIENEVIAEVEETFEDAEEEEEYNDEDEGDEEEYEETSDSDDDMTVEIIYGEDGADFDIIKVFANDYTGSCIIPFYISLDKVDPLDSPTPVDDRNGYWDWLTCFMPAVKFVTMNPDKYLELNEYEYDETDPLQVRFVILGHAETTDEYLVGMYRLAGFFGITGNSQFYIFDDDIYAKINNIVKTTIGKNIISIADSVLGDTDSIIDESNFDGLFKQIGSIVESEEVNEEMEEVEEVVTTNEDQETADMSDLEAASMGVLASEDTLSAFVPPANENTEEDEYDEEATADADEEDMEEETAEDKTPEVEEDDSVLPKGVWGYLVEKKQNKSVHRSFFVDEAHIERISGDQKELYVDITPGPNYGATYKWNGRNFLKVSDPIKPVFVPAKEAEKEVVEDTATAVNPAEQEAPVTPMSQRVSTSKPGAMMPKRTRTVDNTSSTGAIKPKTAKK